METRKEEAETNEGVFDGGGQKSGALEKYLDTITGQEKEGRSSLKRKRKELFSDRRRPLLENRPVNIYRPAR